MGRVVGITVSGPRRTVLYPGNYRQPCGCSVAGKGRIARGYIGLGMQPVHLADKPQEYAFILNSNGA